MKKNKINDEFILTTDDLKFYQNEIYVLKDLFIKEKYDLRDAYTKVLSKLKERE